MEDLTELDLVVIMMVFDRLDELDILTQLFMPDELDFDIEIAHRHISNKIRDVIGG